MTTQYPTPPPTSSPKHSSSYRPFSPNRPAQEIYYQEHIADHKIPAQESFLDGAIIPEQEVYDHEPYSTPTSPKPSRNPKLPPRHSSSPLIVQPPIPYDFASPGGKPPRRQSSISGGVSPNTSPRPGYTRPVRTSPRPMYSSPLNPSPSPYNASRPSPRPGLMKRILAKLHSWLRTAKAWARKNPVKAGLLSFVPVVAGAGLFKAVKELGKGVKGLWNGKLGKEGDKWAYGLEDFKCFAGSKAGPLDGVLKIVQLLINHWCKLTPSSIPRMASIVLELYFLEPWEKKL